jgi:hypothetical protein
VRHVPGYGLRGALSGLLCCSPGLLIALWVPTGGTFAWLVLFIWWAPGVCYGLVVAIPLAVARDRSPIAAAVAFLASAGGYFAALQVTSPRVIEMFGVPPRIGFAFTGAVGASILAAGTLPWRGAAEAWAAVLTVVVGAVAGLLFGFELFAGQSPRSDVMDMLDYTAWFVVWQSATAACLSLGLFGRPSGAPSKGRLRGDGDAVSV